MNGDTLLILQKKKLIIGVEIEKGIEKESLLQVSGLASDLLFQSFYCRLKAHFLEVIPRGKKLKRNK
jgi:hypothetical protein